MIGPGSGVVRVVGGGAGDRFSESLSLADYTVVGGGDCSWESRRVKISGVGFSYC